MKKITITMALVAVMTIANGAEASSNKDGGASSPSVLAKFGTELKNVFNTIKNAGNPKVICQKGKFAPLSATGSVYSLRSFEGRLCEFLPEVMYYGALTCTEANLGKPLFDEFRASQCYTKGAKYIKGKSPEVIAEDLKKAIAGRKSAIKDLVCARIDSAPAFLKSKLAAVCAAPAA